MPLSHWRGYLMSLQKKIALVSIIALLAVLFSNIAFAGELIISDLEVKVEYVRAGAYVVSDLIDSSGPIANNSEIPVEVYPDSTLKFEIDVQNTFLGDEDQDTDIDITDVVATVTIEDLDETENEDIEKDTQDIDLEPGDEKELEIIIDVPQFVEDNDYNVILEVEGEDTEDNKYLIEWVLTLPVKKESVDIRFKQKPFVNSPLACGSDGSVDVELYNAGNEEQDEFHVEIESADLDIKESTQKFDLGNDIDDDDIEVSEEIDFTIPSDASPGSYPLDVSIMWQDLRFYREVVEIDVQCDDPSPTTTTTTSSTSTTTTTNEDENQVTTTTTLQEQIITETEPVVSSNPDQSSENPSSQENETQDPNTQQKPITTSKEFSFSQNPLLMTLLIGLNIIIILGVVAIIVITSKRNQNKP